MTVHTIRRKPATGSQAKRMGLVRIMASIPPDDFRRLTWLAAKRKVPVSNVLRDAVYAYLMPIAPDADRALSAGD